MKLCDINPHIRYARIHKTLPARDNYSRCYDCRLFFLKSGRATLYTNCTEYKITNNTAIYLPPASVYRLAKQSEDFVMVILNFDLVTEFAHLEQSLTTVSEEQFDPSVMPLYELPTEFSEPLILSAPRICDPLEACAQSFLRADRHFRESGSALLKYSLFELLCGASASLAETRLVDAVNDYITKSYHSPELTNESIAAHFGYHPYYLSRVMKLSTGKTLHRAICDYRIRVAKDMLITTEHDISVIAWKCGFNSAAYFTKLFRESAGVTPREYRKSYYSGV